MKKKIDEANRHRKHIIKEEESPEMRSRSPSPTLLDMKVVRNTKGMTVKSNTSGPIKIKRNKDFDDDWWESQIKIFRTDLFIKSKDVNVN